MRIAALAVGIGVTAMAWAVTPSVATTVEIGADRGLSPNDFKALTWRSIGPANMGGRVAAIALHPTDSKTWLIGYGTGGVWKTTNNGTTFLPVFDDVEETSSIGSLACGLKKDEKGEEQLVVWAGTGEGNNRNSSSWGHGVYRSDDGGSTWEHKGLENTHEIPAIAVDPRDVDVCYVGAMGHLWGTNPERGVFKTSDGGTSWQHVLKVDDKTGACDLIVDPSNPDTVYAALYARQRTGWSYEWGSEDSGIYRSDDAGRTWKKLTNGLPGGTGRIGLDLFRGDTKTVYAVIESDEGGIVVDEWQDRSRGGGVFRSNDRGETWERLDNIAPRSFYFSLIRVDPRDANRVYLPGMPVYVSDDGGRTFIGGQWSVMHVDYHALVIDPGDPDRLLVGNDGGHYISYDRGKTWDFFNTMAVGQFYNVAVDDSDPYRIGGGLQDNGSWYGPSENVYRSLGEFMGRKGAITNAEWKFLLFGDGFHVAFHPNDTNIVYAEWQGGNLTRIHLDSGIVRQLRPATREGQPKYRFNWNAPFFISPHDPSVLYLGGNHVFKLTEQGDRWEEISPDLTKNELDKNRSAGSEAETYNTLVSLAESPKKAGVLWAGADDGTIHVSTDGGVTWTNVTPKGRKAYYVTKIEPSHFDEATAYVSIDGHTADFFDPVVLMTTDVGKSWTSIGDDLPRGQPVLVVREDPRNQNVLYVGTERACFVSIDRGKGWTKLNGVEKDKLPTAPVDDLAIQPREMDLVAGTHGRSVWVLDDISPISQLTHEIVNSEFHVFDPIAGQPRYHLDYEGLWSDRMFIAPNPDMGAYLHYWIRDYTDQDVSITIEDANGRTVRDLPGTNRPGINRVLWDLQRDKKEQVPNPDQLPEFVPAGEYKVTVKYGERESSTMVNVRSAPGVSR